MVYDCKRRRRVILTQTDKKGLPNKQKLVEELRKCIDDYALIFLFSAENMRNVKLKELRQEWKTDSRFIFGKQSVMQFALGKTPEDEYHSNLHKLSQMLTGQCGLLFTNRSEREVREYFGHLSSPEYARSGFVAKETMTLPVGEYPVFTFDSESYLRNKLGMATALKRGVVTLLKDYELSKAGKPLNPQQAQVLKLLGRQIAEFRLNLKCVWRKEEGKVKKLKLKSKVAGSVQEKNTDVEDDIKLHMDVDDTMDGK